MVVRVICGSRRSDRAKRIERELTRYWGDALLITPSRLYAADRMYAILQATGLPGCWGRFAYTFHDLAAAVLESEGEKPEILTDLERDILFRHILDDLLEQGVLDGVTRTASTDGFASHMLRVVQDLKQAAVEPDAFRKSILIRKTPSPMDRPVALVYEAYQKCLLDKNVYDRIGIIWQAAQICKTVSPKLLKKTKLLVFDGFDDFTPSEFRLLLALQPHVDFMLFGVQYDPNPQRSDAFGLQEKTLHRLSMELHAETEYAEEPQSDSVLRYVSHMFSGGGELTRKVPDSFVRNTVLEVVPCMGPSHEYEVLARRVKALILDERVAPSDIAVVYRKSGHDTSCLRSVFREFGIPVRPSYNRPLSHSNVGAFVLSALDTMDEWEREATVDLLRSPWCGADNHTQDLADTARQLSMFAGIVSGYEEWQARLSHLASGLSSHEHPHSPVGKGAARIPNVHDCLTQLSFRLEKLHRVMEPFASCRTMSDFAGALENMIESLDFQSVAERLDTEQNRTDAHLVALSGLWRVAGLLRNSDTGVSHTLSRFVRRFRRMMQMESYCVEEADAQGVFCADAGQIRNLTFRMVFLAHLNEGIFPGPRAINAVYSEYDVEDFVRAGIPLEVSAQHDLRETSLFQHVLEAAQERLYLFWRTRDAAGRELNRSPFLEELLRVIGPHVEQPIPNADGFIPSLDQIGSWSDLCVAAMHHDLDVCRNTTRMQPILFGAETEHVRRDDQPPGPWDGVLDDAEVITALRTDFGTDHVYSVNRLEMYMHCPFHFFVESVLDIQENETPAHIVDARTRGIAVHDILQRFHQHFAGHPLSELRSEHAEQVLLSVIEEVMESIARRHSPLLAGILHVEHRIITTRLRKYLEWEVADYSGWSPHYFEVAFGRTQREWVDPFSTEQAVEILTETGPIRFSGVIDRLDIQGTALRLIDYKTGKPPTGDSTRTGKSIQLPVYVMAVESLCQDNTCTQAQYIHVGRKKAESHMDRSKNDIWVSTLEASRNTIAEIVQHIRDGVFTVQPADKKTCGYCPVRPACRFESSRLEQKNQDEEE